MGRIRINRNGFITGLLSRQAQASSDSELYNFGLDIADNCIIKPLGGAWKRPGTIYYSEKLTPYIKTYQFSYSAGKYCLVILSSEGVEFIDLKNNRKIAPEQLDQYWTEEDVPNIQMFHFENKLYIYCPSTKRDFGFETRPKSIYWIFESQPRQDIEDDFNIIKLPEPTNFINAPVSYMWPARNLKFVSIDPVKIALYADNPDILTVGLFTEADIGRQLVIRIENPASGQLPAKVIFPRFYITQANLQEAEVTLELVPDTGNLPEVGYTVDKWWITAFTGNGSNNGRLGIPAGHTIHEGRLYLYQGETIIGSRLDGFPLDFKYSAEDDSSISKLAPSSIYWAVSSSKLIIGCSDGIYIAGGVTGNRIGVSQSSIGINNISRIVPSRLQPIPLKEGIIFVGSDGYKVYSVTVSEQGYYVVDQINQICENVTLSGVVSHAIQTSPYNIYWAVTGSGTLVSCIIARNAPTYRWTTHTIGGEDGTYVVKVWTSNEGDFDTVWLLVRRLHEGTYKYYIEYISNFYDEATSKDGVFLDCSKIKNYPVPIIDMRNGGDFVLDINDDNVSLSEEFTSLLNTRNNLKLQLHGVSVDGTLHNIMYAPFEMQYYGLTKKTFGIDISIEKEAQHSATLKNLDMRSQTFRYMTIMPVFKSELFITKIENFTNFSIFPPLQNTVLITFNTEIPSNIDISKLYFSTTFLGDISADEENELNMDTNIYKLFRESETEFSLLDYSTGKYINVELNEDKLIPEKLARADIYIGEQLAERKLWVQRPNQTQSTITFGTHWYNGQNLPDDFNPDGTGKSDIWHNVYTLLVPGVPQFGRQRFRLAPDILVDGDKGEKFPRYFIYHYPEEYALPRPAEDNQLNRLVYSKINLVPTMKNVGLFEKYISDAGIAYWMFSGISKNDIKWLTNTVCSFIANESDTGEDIMISDDKFDDEDIYWFSEERYSCIIGYRYNYELYPVPLMGGSAYGSSEGELGNQKNVIISVYQSIGGKYAASPEKKSEVYDIDYSDNPERLEFPWQTYTGNIKLTVRASPDPTSRSLYIISSEAQSFNLLTMIHDVIINDDS